MKAHHVGNVQQIVDVIRLQLAARAGRVEARPLPTQRQATDTPNPRPDLLTLVGQRVKAIGRDDPDRGRKAFRVFLESLLVAELDESIINDPQFYRMVDDVQRQMEADPQIAASIRAAIQHLLAAET
jgi:hypothetical protein